MQFKLSEKEREAEMLHHRLLHVESELDRQRKKVQSLRENVKAKGVNAVEERRLADNAIEVLSSELRVAKQDLADSIARERQVNVLDAQSSVQLKRKMTVCCLHFRFVLECWTIDTKTKIKNEERNTGRFCFQLMDTDFLFKKP